MSLTIQNVVNQLKETLIETNKHFNTDIALDFEITGNSIKVNQNKFKIKKIYKILKDLNQPDVFTMRFGRYFEETYSEKLADTIYTDNILTSAANVGNKFLNAKTQIKYDDGTLIIKYEYNQANNLNSNEFAKLIKNTPKYLSPKIIAESHTVLANSVTLQYQI